MICQNTYKTFFYYSTYVKYIYFVSNTYIQTTHLINTYERSRNVQQSSAVAACFSDQPDPQTPSQLEAGHLPSSFG